MFNSAFTLQRRLQVAAQPTSTMRSIVAPIGGWNKRDPVPQMAADDALVLDNFIPGQAGVRMRHGYEEHATGVTGNFVETLMEYNSASGTPKLFAAGPANIFDVTASGAVGSAAVTGLTNGRWQHCMFATSGGQFLVCANGADSVRNYDGSSWTTPTINNVTSSTLIHVTPHAKRLFFIQSGSTKFWYLATESISGDATSFDLGPLCKKGGHLIAMATWTRDGGSGMDDAAVFVTSEGEIIIYEGTDPSSANTWTLRGVFQWPKPISRRCFIKFGANLAYLSSIGVIPLPAALAENSAGLVNVAATNKITSAFIDAYSTSGDNFGWQVIEYPKRNLLIVNVPLTQRVKQHQYVMNLQTGAWCRFTGLNAGCWGLKGDVLYWGGNDGTVNAYGEDGIYADDGSPIVSTSISAYSNFGTQQVKRFEMARPLLEGPTDYIPQIALLTDYQVSIPAFSPTAYSVSGPFWDEALWDEELWAAGLAVNALWQSITGTGHVGAIALASSSTRPLVFNAVDVMFQPGGML